MTMRMTEEFKRQIMILYYDAQLEAEKLQIPFEPNNYCWEIGYNVGYTLEYKNGLYIGTADYNIVKTICDIPVRYANFHDMDCIRLWKEVK